MYLDFEDYRPNIEPVGRALTGLEVVLLTIVFHLTMIIVLLVAPRYFPDFFKPRPIPEAVLAQQRAREQQPRFVFMEPLRDVPAAKPPPRAEASDINRRARSRESAKNPTNPLPFSRGNTHERVEAQSPQTARAGEPVPSLPPGAPPQSSQSDILNNPNATLQVPAPSPAPRAPANRAVGSGGGGTSALGEALRNLGRYVQKDQFDNRGGTGQPDASIQFDSKGVDFGPWLRRFIAQVRRNWTVPYAAMSMKGHVTITFNVHKSGAISDVTVVGPSAIEGFNTAAFGALIASNPTTPLPQEYPDEKAFFTFMFFYNEEPPGGGR